MTKPTFDQDFWDELWSKTPREHAGTGVDAVIRARRRTEGAEANARRR